MGCVQMSQFVAMERILYVSGDGEGVLSVAVVVAVGVELLLGGMRQMGRRAWVQHRPWFTQRLQKPQSPSLHWSHFQ